jgi:photosystem II stability/assembly factor-like uncharacterized protein
MRSRRFEAFTSLLLLFGSVAFCCAQSVNPALFSDMRWREIGPMRAGRTRALAGVPSQPATFYMGAVNGGVWKTTDSGDTWHSLWNSQPTGSIGAIAVSLSNPNIIYVGSGEGLARPDLSVGDGVYKSTDAGKTWTHLGLRDGQQIGQLAIDPHNPDRVFVAVTGHPYGPNKERGLYRSTDGGKTFQNVLYIDEYTGASEVRIDPHHPDTVYAGMWEREEGAWENGSWSGTHGGFFKSTDGGEHWTKITGGGLPDDIIQVNVALSPSDSNRIYIEAATEKNIGIYRSEDDGKTWVHAPQDDPRPEVRVGGGGELPVIMVDPHDPNTVYVTSVVTWKSTDGGRTWTGFRGSPRSPVIRASSSRRTAARLGPSGTTSPPRRCITSQSTTHFPIASAEASRTVAAPASPAAAMTAASPSMTGIPSVLKSMATPRPIRSTLTSSTAAKSPATIAALVRSRTSHPALSANIASFVPSR